MTTCPACGADVTDDRCPDCGWTAPPVRDDAGLLLPSGPRGAILATLLAAAVFGGVWGLFAWLAPTPASTPGAATAPTSTPPARAAATTGPPSTTPVPTPAAPRPTPSPTPTPVDWDAVAGRVAPAIARVSGDRCAGPTRRGAGVLVTPDQVLTSAHVVTEAPAIRVLVGAEERSARILSLDHDQDLALLSLAEPLPGPVLPLVPDLVAVDDELGIVTADPTAGTTAMPVPVTATGLRVPTRGGAVSDVLTVALDADSGWAGAPVVTADGGLAGILLVDHVEGAVAGTGHVLSAETAADQVTAWAGDPPAARHGCGSPEPTPDATPGAAPAPTSAPTTREADPFASADVDWIAVVESLTVERHRQSAMRARARDWDRALSLPRQGVRTRLLRSDDWPSLEPGFWVLYLGRWATVEEARAACAAVRSVAPGCYAADLRR